MKAVVTGGFGFIGSNLVDYLLVRNWDVTIIDNLSGNVVHPAEYSNCRQLIGNVENMVGSLPNDVNIFFHLASFVGPSRILSHGGKMAGIIVGDTEAAINYCLKNNALFINVSTSEIYGYAALLSEHSEKIFPGTYSIRTEYGASKMLSEIITINRARTSDLRFQIIRPFNVSGYRQKPDGGFVLPRFVVAALTEQPITVYGDGSQERAFADVRDVCDVIYRIALSPHRHEVWNIGNLTNRMSILKLAQLVVRIMNEKHPFIPCRIALVDPKSIHGHLFEDTADKLPNTTKVQQLLGWKPRFSIEETISDMIDDYYSKVKGEAYYYKVI